MEIKKHCLIIFLLISTKLVFAQPIINSMIVYPNPFNEAATISIDLAENDTISLTLFSITGRELKTILKDSFFLSGSYSIKLLGDSLTDGVYFLNLQYAFDKSINVKIIKSIASSVSKLIKGNQSYLLYPNPVKETLHTDIEGLKTIIIHNSIGEMVKSFQTQSKDISFSDVLAGIYFISVLDEENNMISRMQVLHE
jgi:hypothetical protein